MSTKKLSVRNMKTLSVHFIAKRPVRINGTQAFGYELGFNKPMLFLGCQSFFDFGQGIVDAEKQNEQLAVDANCNWTQD